VQKQRTKEGSQEVTPSTSVEYPPTVKDGSKLFPRFKESDSWMKHSVHMNDKQEAGWGE
jgi:hypothetical protein